MESKKLVLPFVEGLDNAASLEEFSSMLCNATAATKVATLNWPDDFPYCPECNVRAAWCDKGLGILYNVKGLDLRALAMSDNGSVWQDSCCEFFVSDPCDGTYYNFEMNCIGTLLVSKRKSREDCVHYTADKLKKVKRFTSLERKQVEINDKEFSWSVGMFIPFSLIGIDKHHIPTSLKANFYKCGDLTAHTHFLSWSPIDTPKPDFHRPDFFGTLELAPKPAPSFARIIFPLMFICYICAVGFLCFGHFEDMPDVATTIFGIPTDKVVHFSMFFPFPLLAYATFGRKTKGRWKSILFILAIFLVGCILGIATELGQGLTDYRSCDINDFRADALGMALSSVFALIIDSIRHSSKR